MGRPPVEKTTGRTWESLDSKHRILPLSDKADRRQQFGVVLSIIIGFHAFQLALSSVFSNCVYYVVVTRGLSLFSCFVVGRGVHSTTKKETPCRSQNEIRTSLLLLTRRFPRRQKPVLIAIKAYLVC
ncbi:hypothetical protein LZ31DRAFT_119213 [Colletotrichum somersetense]|nr:hypothetical protein LZ31DRAFT_119213 [Colletotrichum somersetense]